jgi:hypothetical protein
VGWTCSGRVIFIFILFCRNGRGGEGDMGRPPASAGKWLASARGSSSHTIETPSPGASARAGAHTPSGAAATRSTVAGLLLHAPFALRPEPGH